MHFFTKILQHFSVIFEDHAKQIFDVDQEKCFL